MESIKNQMLKEGDLIPAHNSFVHYKFNGEMIECHQMAYNYIQDLESIINCVKMYCEGAIKSDECIVEFYKGNQKKKDDFASELHLLTQNLIKLDNILDIIKKGSE